MGDIFTSAIRTVTPYIIGAVASWLATKGINAPDALVAQATAILTFCFGTIYYLVVRYVEQKYPKVGYLLGTPSQPTYDK